MLAWTLTGTTPSGRSLPPQSIYLPSKQMLNLAELKCGNYFRFVRGVCSPVLLRSGIIRGTVQCIVESASRLNSANIVNLIGTLRENPTLSAICP
ncbi:hypothetical protein HOE425_340163 [Hoeflea sp. EC-HK425]|nr:hypothetical protein HOE425_340163 [Hoeflea sp. EC-HK425]